MHSLVVDHGVLAQTRAEERRNMYNAQGEFEGLMSAKLIYVLSSFHMLFCAFYIHIHVKIIKVPLNLVL